MSSIASPVVSVLTPVYNGAAYLNECIESVLAQTYPHWEYIIVNNASTDRTREIAERYAEMDERIKVHNNDALLPIIANHNHAFSLISPDSKYCKVVSADDVIFPGCLGAMVRLAEAHPSVGIVGSYQLSGSDDDWHVRCTGLPYWRSVVSGEEIGRRYLLTGWNVFGAPTANLYRCDLVRGSDAFFPNPRAEADISACVKHLRHTDWGFVHQVLSYERCHNDRTSITSWAFSAYITSKIHDVLAYGCDYLTAGEMEKRLAQLWDEYYRVLAIAAVNFKDSGYWRVQQERFSEFGVRLDRMRLVKAIFGKVLDLLLSPRETFQKLARRWGGGAAQVRMLSLRRRRVRSALPLRTK